MNIRITYPFAIKQVGDSTIEISAKHMDRPLLRESAVEALAPYLSHSEQDKLSDDIHDYAIAEAIKRAGNVYRFTGQA